MYKMKVNKATKSMEIWYGKEFTGMRIVRTSKGFMYRDFPTIVFDSVKALLSHVSEHYGN